LASLVLEALSFFAGTDFAETFFAALEVAICLEPLETPLDLTGA
jgi:hypothetical protein